MLRDAASVPITVIADAARVDDLAAVLAAADRVAIDTEVPIDGPRSGELRVMSVATRTPDGERAFVIDARDVDPMLLAPVLEGVTADAWNAGFDARVIDAAVYRTSDTTGAITWWDAQIADALIHQGRSGFAWYHGLAWATSHYLGIDIEGKGTTQLSFTATDDLTAEQISYSAADAVLTLWVSDRIRVEIERARLSEICEIEQGARPFLDRMERTGLPFDHEGWKIELAQIEAQHRASIGKLAGLTGGGQGTLFDDVVEPTWNPASDAQVREALNRWAAPQVRMWAKTREGAERLLTDTDSMRAGVLREIGGELCEALLEYRNQAKVITTYGESIVEHVHPDGRLRPQYVQVVGTNTGRLASRNPNAQNFTPRMKPYLRPEREDRVFVHADLSQAELRYLAQVAEDEPLRRAFERGVDVHVSTAASMFGFEPEDLSDSDPERFKRLRQIAKALNFGIAYGSGAASLGRTLTAEGTPTTTEEAAELLARYRRTYPGTASWGEARIAEIKKIAEETSVIDWRLSMRLARGFRDMDSIRREFRAIEGRRPTVDEIAERHPDRIDSPDVRAEIEWLARYSAPVALVSGGEPFRFSSRTLAGRRQQFELHLDRLFLVASISAIRSPDPDLESVRHRFERDHAVSLTAASDGHVERVFENRSLRRQYIESLGDCLGDDVAHAWLGKAARERVSAMVNAWRNAPIQGGVADIMLSAYADLHQRLERYPSARPVQTVHDSVVIECDVSDAPSVAEEVRTALETASRRFCPDVTPRADVDIRTSLADADTLPTT
ncbi:MAG: DNA polymerase [Acidimicrobiia bacterium]|nr:DNA polymerase [Acidimicrobiia bacterium]MDH4306603.1 DNA polymerase [Acidimicrobiia bacterium]MDH5292798.1 DNA polymerase [Acidimicrobiia bacterium]